MGLSNELSCEAGAFSTATTPQVLQSDVLRLYFSTLEPWISQSLLLSSCSSQFICTNVGPSALPAALPATALSIWVLQLLPSHMSSLPQLPVCTPPTGLDECFFNSLVVGLPCGLTFWQFWLFFVSKLIVILLVVQGSKVFLPMPLSWPEFRSGLFLRTKYCYHT